MEWVCGSAVSCCTWSQCSQYIVFCTSAATGAATLLYSVSPYLATNTASTLADLTAVEVADADGDVVR